MVSVTLNLNTAETSLKPNDDVQLTTTIHSNGAAISDIQYRYMGRVGGTSKSIRDATGTSCTYKLKVLGDVSFKVEVGYSCNGEYKWVSSNEVTVHSQYYLSEFICNYSSNMSSAWNSTLSAISAGKEKREDGFILDLVRGGGYDVRTFSVNGSCSSLVTNTKPQMYFNMPSNVDLNLGADRLTIGDFHTHSPLTNCSDQLRNPGASDDDTSQIRKWPWIVHDYAETIHAGESASKTSKDYTYGNTTTY
jgi:hypothetical protein